MYVPWASSDTVRRVMQGNRSRDTKAEIAVRRLVHAKGLRYRVSAKPEADVRRTADLVFRGPKVVVFIDGCYWHGCPEHFKAPQTNADYWSAKVGRNRARDVETTQILEQRGWCVLRFWEHEEPRLVALRIAHVVSARQSQRPERSRKRPR